MRFLKKRLETHSSNSHYDMHLSDAGRARLSPARRRAGRRSKVGRARMIAARWGQTRPTLMSPPARWGQTRPTLVRIADLNFALFVRRNFWLSLFVVSLFTAHAQNQS